MNSDTKAKKILEVRTVFFKSVNFDIDSSQLSTLEDTYLKLNLFYTFTNLSWSKRQDINKFITNIKFLKGFIEEIPSIPPLTLAHFANLISGLDSFLGVINNFPDPTIQPAKNLVLTHLIGIIETFAGTRKLTMKQKISIGKYLKTYILIRKNNEKQLHVEGKLDLKTYRKHLVLYNKKPKEIDHERRISIQYAEMQLEQYIAMEQRRNPQARWE